MKITSAQLRLLAALPMLGGFAAGVQAQDTGKNTSVLLEEVLVTATKKAKAEELQDVPIAATAFGERQLEALFVRDLQSLSYTMPNVSMEDVGTAKGIANFSFRGLGINSSIPSIDPTVGVFIDGVYQGTNQGVVFDQFDMAGVEVLRGPQGILFGRNVTGGAVLVRTTDPTTEKSLKLRASVESGNNTYLSAVVSGPIYQDKLLGKLAVYGNKDMGYFENKANGNDSFGDSKTLMIRGGLTWLHDGDANAETTFKIEQADSEGDGPAGQNHALYSRKDFDFAIDEEGFFDMEWTRASLQHTRDFAGGQITNIFGWKDLETTAVTDIDATPFFIFHAPTALNAEQFSNELRYNILIDDRFDVTTGLYYFTQEIMYIEQRLIPPAGLDLTGGGEQEQTTYGLFAAVDYRLTDNLSLLAGVRYTMEEKDAKVARIQNNNCSIDSTSCSGYQFEDDEDWSNVSPKLGVQWYPMETLQVYGSYSKGFRSGGYNLRNTDPDPNRPPGPFDEEEQDAFELGAKWDGLDGMLRLNGAVFHNEISDMQRELNYPGPIGVAQFVVNSADATIMGAEFEALAALGKYLVLSANVGYLDGQYDKMSVDLNQDGNIDGKDKKLDIPRLADWTYGVGLTLQNDLDNGSRVMARIGFNHRDPSAYTDDNRGILNSADMVDAAVSLSTSNGFTYSLFGRNLKDEATHGGDTQLPATFGGPGASFAPLNKGRVYGAEIKYSY